ncbi:two-component system chemotaxis sensor kinase CheA [Oceanisphaera litoralis]|uniref:chemotaxis protein CheA n=1 Tax=Oceanisphaera litoralis TaxID=225144 RepID=UPI0019591D83|nr:chemotaxis protein CheA [Oceanisphaera litoralis]MBM7456582.1 two-component system chemotaxis sensor kinase CheA [Oceanisphaera litoralis]
MGFEVDEDILQDFLVEASEILEHLSEQLVALERQPDDKDLLNAIFRGFHTVKGGAGFLSLTALVEICHKAENVFDILRTGRRRVNSELMDVILRALDAVNSMFAEIKDRKDPTPAEPPLLDALERYCQPASDDEAMADTGMTPVVDSTIAGLSETEYRQMLDELVPEVAAGNRADMASAALADTVADTVSVADSVSVADTVSVVDTVADNTPAGSGDDITDDEFEALLDQLHGVGKHGGAPLPAAAPPSPSSGGDDEIDDLEFEALLDQLHGAGKGPTVTASVPAPVTPPASDPVTTSGAHIVAATAVAERAPAKPPAKPPANPPAKSPAKAPAPDTTVRVDTRTLDNIMNMVGELVLVRNRLLSLDASHDNEDISKTVANLDAVTGDLQGAVMKTRMQPIKKVFGRFPRVVRDLARSLNKEINLEMVGEDTDLDKNLVEALADPLVHLVRNSCDHGVEMPGEREAAGKPRAGTIRLTASQEGDHIQLGIEDDGAGMDPEKLKSIAIKRGILDADGAARMSDNEAYNLIFAPGFSTKQEITDVSGRGVGMDVVKTGITAVNGSIHIDSEKGKGTRLQIKVPLTLAILPTLMVLVGKQTFALPLTNVNEIFHLDLTRTSTVDGQLTIVVRNRAIPLFYLQDWLLKGERRARKEKGHVVIVVVGNQQVGFVVDGLIGQEEVVIKPLDKLLHGTPGMAGATITSDGGIALILDLAGLIKAYARRYA